MLLVSLGEFELLQLRNWSFLDDRREECQGPEALGFYWRTRVNCGRTLCDNALAVWVFNQEGEHDYPDRDQH
jgi:hypothetical protein